MLARRRSLDRLIEPFYPYLVPPCPRSCASFFSCSRESIHVDAWPPIAQLIGRMNITSVNERFTRTQHSQLAFNSNHLEGEHWNEPDDLSTAIIEYRTTHFFGNQTVTELRDTRRFQRLWSVHVTPHRHGFARLVLATSSKSSACRSRTALISEKYSFLGW